MRGYLEHKLNPLHLYCRLVPVIGRKRAKWLCSMLEPAIKAMVYQKPIEPVKTMFDEIIATEREFLATV
jgi:hypothetical protein